jgi:hypothetical protein
MGWTAEHRGFVVEAYYENNRKKKLFYVLLRDIFNFFLDIFFYFLPINKNCFLCTFQKHIQFFLDIFFHFLYLFKMWAIFMPHPVVSDILQDCSTVIFVLSP